MEEGMQMDDVIQQCMDYLRDRASVDQTIKRSQVPPQLIDITKQLIADFQTRLTQNLNGIPNTAYILIWMLKDYNAGVPMDVGDLDVIDTALRNQDAFLRMMYQKGLGDDQAYRAKLNSLYDALRPGEGAEYTGQNRKV